MKRTVSAVLCTALIFLQLLCTAQAKDVEGYVKMTGLFESIRALINKDKILATEFRGESSCEQWSEQDTYSLDGTSVVIKEKGRDFVVLNITDIHFSDYDIRAFMAFPAISTMKKLVREVKPDLITVTGDIVCGNSTEYSVRRFTDLMESFGIPWAPVFGNHDAEGNCDYSYLADIMLKSSHCLLKKGDASMGVGNYVVNIAEKNSDGSMNVTESLIMMDTHKTHVSQKQIEWYEWAVRGINGVCGRQVETTVFFHIPLAEYQYAFDAAWDAENSRWRDGFGAAGELNEKICCHRDGEGNPINNGFFAAAKCSGTTKNIICGHEHMNNFSVEYEGIRLTYTLKVGKGSGYEPGFNGGTVIQFGSNGLASIAHKFVNFGIIHTQTVYIK